MTYMDDIVGVGESSPEFLAIGYCDICIQGLTAGTIKVQYRLPKTTVLTAPDWKDFPDGSYTADTFDTLFVSQHGVYIKFLGVGNNAGVYVKAARHNNK